LPSGEFVSGIGLCGKIKGHETGGPRKGHLVSWLRVIWVWPNQVRLCSLIFTVQVYWVVLSCVFFCVIWFCLLVP